MTSEERAIEADNAVAVARVLPDLIRAMDVSESTESMDSDDRVHLRGLVRDSIRNLGAALEALAPRF